MINEKKINIIFDFDGVILNSNKVKTIAFKKIAKRFGNENSKKLIAYHLKNGGISRYKKIRWFVEKVLKVNNEELINELIFAYGLEVSKSLNNCEFRTDLDVLKNKLKGTSWSIASGGKQEEIINFLYLKNKLDFFESGIFGSPTPKIDIVKKIILNKKSEEDKFVLIGDSYYDFECALKNKIKFIFVYEWSEILNPKKVFNKHNVHFIKGIECLDIKLLRYI